jgi:hypothetical protein
MPRRIDDVYRDEFRQVVVAVMMERGNDPSVCHFCGAEGKTQIHHLRYDGATVDDLRFVCQRCNLQPENKKLE